MDPFTIEYIVTIGDFRKATYYALFIRHRRPLQIMFLVLIGSIIYAAAAGMGLGTPNPLVFLLAGAYLLWGIFLFAGAEKSIRVYIKNPDNFLGCRYLAHFEKSRIRIRVPERKVDFSCSIHHLACVFELSALFMVYTSAQDVHLIPKYAMTTEQITALRSNFRSLLKERFSPGRVVRK